MTAGAFGAVAQRYPAEMGRSGVAAVGRHLRDRVNPAPSEGLDFVNTGVRLVTDGLVAGIEGISSAEGAKECR
ncbi:hypothetical protein FAF44_14855 [Nonomuraea sp. MG754425]|uniref:hypothetical protein n=1 Tax=Nonomuraea sp. MG754425 TaxID=2570319 RepID=UPI001F2ED966|nr:hypothetical protein [Nonomuraea sp. MG754425]MCF6469660.1 hypothetical protein [Nonomuraea sp. MG754425]